MYLLWGAHAQAKAGLIRDAASRHGREALVPFVKAIVPKVDVPGGTVVVNPPPGLLEL